MFQALVFDLDDTLLDTSALLIPIAHTSLFRERISRPLPLMPGALENLNFLKSKYQLFLVTFGEPEVQRAKIESLQISKFFTECFIVDSNSGQDKSHSFKSIAHRYLANENVLSIGNRRSTDIRLAKLAGLQTCLFDYGEHQLERAEQVADAPDFTVSNHFELVRTCRL